MSTDRRQKLGLRIAAALFFTSGICIILTAAAGQPVGDLFRVAALGFAVIVFTCAGTLLTLASKRSKDR